tara:strand:+ start:25092 stop:25946 length:855 start_codon:yes stop_codon:yes gene_type:complete
MITFFTIPRQFTNLHNIIQSNAILSWKEIKPECEIIVFSDHSSISSFCDKNNIKHIDNFEINSFGTPILSDIWKKAKKHSKYDTLCYINTDIILFPDFYRNLQKVKLDKYLLAGRRWDLNIDYHIDFSSKWFFSLKDEIHKKGNLHPVTGVDFFLFPKTLMPKMPPFAIGRAWWDNWLLTHFLNKKIPLIDGTYITSVHQNHDYNHIKSVSTNTTNKGLEREKNQSLANLKNWQIKDISDCTHILSKSGVKKMPFYLRFRRILVRNIFGFLSYYKKKIVTLFST